MGVIIAIALHTPPSNETGSASRLSCPPALRVAARLPGRPSSRRSETKLMGTLTHGRPGTKRRGSCSRNLLSVDPTRDDARRRRTSLLRRPDMAKELKCSDIGMKTCNFVAQGKDEKDVMAKAAEHAKSAHGMNTIPPDVEKRARTAIREAQGKPFTAGQKV